jgi:type IV pilus assembly protein PilB
VGDLLLVVFANPFEVTVPAKINEMTGMKVVRMLGREKDIREKFNQGQDNRSTGFDDVVQQIGAEFGTTLQVGEDDVVNEESGPIIQLANRIIEDAYFAGASDIHIEPQENEIIVRYRIDGLCQEKLRLPAKVAPALVARVKIMCNLDIAERRLPQDGRIIFKQFTKKSLDLDLRVSTAPLNHGEGMVMRILDKQKAMLPLPALGFSEEALERYRQVIRQPYGMILHCGPTGSGKSMTLYSALNEINSPEIVIRTAEDPIEYTLMGINQMQMHRQIGLTFAAALRSFLRQDPDIILVGEIRDKETAEISVEAALTGHLLMSTLHTNDAPSTIARLTDMGIEPFMISSSLLCVCSQRLMRRVCKTCRVSYIPQGREKEVMEKAIGWSGQIYRHNARGCSKCGGSGYKGRVGIHELMISNDELVDGINKQIETSELKKIAMRGGMKTLHQDSLLKVKEGVTTLEEAIATVAPDL